ncbi:hypothetical protein LPTSP4_06250 [Leptospira ryugenii]|uniref:GPI inositol-deacylase PGAP1-like alpha/beta domain-containing protein n=1 Tax=Leptospira ryugenii TaxID=1917863 RepID=A0A2P2DWU6_9LEPT|nr:hypothetical protein LPTSP4_06250 [Leptospira ryugenii]
MYYVWKKEFATEERNNEALTLSLLNVIQNPNQELFSFTPALSRDLADWQYQESSLFQSGEKPKLIYIHGWNPIERDSDPFTSRSRKILNIQGTFKNGIIYFQENLSGVKDQFELYLFTYRTSNGIIFNGEGFNDFLNRKFKPTDKVFVIAHSMGGLVTRAAMKSNRYQKDMIDGVATLASPIFGSPFASKQYMSNNSTFVTEITGFLLETQGGSDLTHTNTGLGQSTISGSTNLVLDVLNQDFPYNAKFLTFSGVLTSCNGAETFYYRTGCQILAQSSPSFPFNDGIVPENSAWMGASGSKRFQINGFDHSMMAFQTTNVDDANAKAYYEQVIREIRSSFLP